LQFVLGSLVKEFNQSAMLTVSRKQFLFVGGVGLAIQVFVMDNLVYEEERLFVKLRLLVHFVLLFTGLAIS